MPIVSSAVKEVIRETIQKGRSERCSVVLSSPIILPFKCQTLSAEQLLLKVTVCFISSSVNFHPF